MQETLELTATLHRTHPQRELILRLIRNTGIEKRHLIQPLDQTLRHPGFEERNKTYERHAKRMLPPVIHNALANADREPKDIDAIIYVSCTGFMMPSMTAWLINTLGLRPDTRQLPIAQLGCAAGVAAINRAHDLCLAWPGGNVLVVSCEFCSLCYQPDDTGVGEILSDGLFGDAVAAAVVTGAAGTQGIELRHNAAHLIPGTESWISYAVKATGFHFRLDSRVPKTMESLAPVIKNLAAERRWDAGQLGFYLVHAGGPRIIDDLGKFLDVPADGFRHSRATLTEYGNIASAVVLDAARRLFKNGDVKPGAKGLLAGFGPGITAEIALGTWQQA